MNCRKNVKNSLVKEKYNRTGHSQESADLVRASVVKGL